MSSTAPSESDGDLTIKAIDETTPLLTMAAKGPIAEPAEEHIQNTNSQDEENEKPLPLGQILLLCYARLVEPIAFFSIFPYINEMIYILGDIPEADVGFYSGLIESLFSFTQMCVMLGWGRASDRFGRKPVLVFSMLGVTIATALFGLSKTVWQMILFRCFAGMFAGTIITIRTMITEHSTRKTQARAFSFFAFAGNIGIFIGPLIGGALSNPTKQYPAVFGNIQFFKNYPYALPTFVAGGIGATATIISVLFVEETLHQKDSNDDTSKAPPMSTWKIAKHPGVGIVLGLHSHIALLAFAYTAILPVFLFEPIELGGAQLSPPQISAVMGLGGLSQAIWLLIAFPYLQHRIGTVGVLRMCSIAWPFFFAACPLCSIFLQHHLMAPFWTLGSIALVVGSGVAMAFTGVQLALNDISPSYETLGTLNALALTLSSGIRAVTPALATSLVAAGIRTQILNGYLAWLVLIVLALALCVVVRWLPTKAEGKLKKRDTDEA
ncbi:MFS general substrate transporter [Glonium stellatum]|uniref:MFS general substrate transporter n=1 Tax=Glonium stellatum TaxID=574774 RepID=A0A8E2JX97_9PEZI|nr:MFS general substrate transporter [Glonium stellatum]